MCNWTAFKKNASKLKQNFAAILLTVKKIEWSKEDVNCPNDRGPIIFHQAAAIEKILATGQKMFFWG